MGEVKLSALVSVPPLSLLVCCRAEVWMRLDSGAWILNLAHVILHKAGRPRMPCRSVLWGHLAQSMMYVPWSGLLCHLLGKMNLPIESGSQGGEVDGLRGRGDPAPGIPGESFHAWGFGTRWIPYTFLNLRECVSSSKKYLFKWGQDLILISSATN